MSPSLPALIGPGHRFLFSQEGREDVEYVVSDAENFTGGQGPESLVRLHRPDVTPERPRDYAHVTTHWLRKSPPGYSGYFTFLGGEVDEAA